MKLHTLPVKRRPVSKGILKRLSAVIGNRKQRVAATAVPGELEDEDGSSKISRALTIIFLIHIVAIGLIFIHQRFLDGRTTNEPKTPQVVKEEAVPTVAGEQHRLDLPRMASGEKPYIVRQGDNYARAATFLGVDEADLRLINKHVDIGPGVLLKIPPKRSERIVAVEPPEVSAIREHTPLDSAGGLVEAVPVSVAGAPRAQLVHPNISHAPEAPRLAKSETTPVVATSGKTYVTRDGDSIWRIANKFKVNQDALMKANGITDARKIRAGMNLVIPR